MQQELIPHLFRTEYRKIVAVLSRRFGLDELAAAEDIASDTFLTAAQTWSYKGIPAEPVAWLYTVAKNKAKNYLQRTHLFTGKIVPALAASAEENNPADIDLSAENITDSQLQMLFAVCHPLLSPEAQVGLALRVLCGFGIEEIAGAFLSNKETISKRLFRAREKLRQEKVQLVFPAREEIDTRLDSVLQTLYLLFNEGYYSEHNNSVLREDLCLEAMRLNYLLLENEQTRLPRVNALLSLMCFHASRFAARRNNSGAVILYQQQDTALWNEALITRGALLLKEAAAGNRISTYHLEASIAYWHTQKTDSREKWVHILQLYNQLLQLSNSPIAALNRIFALSRVAGKTAAIAEAEQLNLTGNQYYFALLGELYTGIDRQKAKTHFEQAKALAKTTADRSSMQQKLDSIFPA